MNDEFHYYYKFMPFDEGSIRVLTEGTIKYTCPLDFNDPFDCKPAYCPEALKNLDKNKSELLKNAARLAGMSPAQRIEGRGKTAAKLRTYIKSGKSLAQLMNTIGVLSLSKVANNILMWSHYAQHHQGFAVEFKVPKYGELGSIKEIGPRLVAQEVIYSEKRPLLAYGIDDRETAINKMLLIKSVLWEYEDEARVVDANRGPGIHPFEHVYVNAVISGMNMPPEKKENLKAALNEVIARKPTELSHIKYYEAEACEATYKVLIPGHPVWGRSAT